MRILFDQETPRGLIREFPEHAVTTAKAMGCDQLSNGELLKAAENAAFDLFLTTDQRIQYQQNLAGRKIAIVVLSGTTKWLQVQLHVDRIVVAVGASAPGTYAEVFIPFTPKSNRS